MKTQFEGVRGFLEAQQLAIRMHQKRGGRCWKNGYTCFADFLLRHGREWTFRRSRHQGTPRECYRDAFLLARNNPRLAYCEGLASSRFFPVEHAWCVTKDGHVVDPTWWQNPSEGRQYFGVAIQLEFVREMIEATETWCGALCVPALRFPIFTRPEADWKHPYNEKT